MIKQHVGYITVNNRYKKKKSYYLIKKYYARCKRGLSHIKNNKLAGPGLVTPILTALRE